MGSLNDKESFLWSEVYAAISVVLTVKSLKRQNKANFVKVLISRNKHKYLGAFLLTEWQQKQSS